MIFLSMFSKSRSDISVKCQFGGIFFSNPLVFLLGFIFRVRGKIAIYFRKYLDYGVDFNRFSIHLIKSLR